MLLLNFSVSFSFLLFFDQKEAASAGAQLLGGLEMRGTFERARRSTAAAFATLHRSATNLSRCSITNGETLEQVRTEFVSRTR